MRITQGMMYSSMNSDMNRLLGDYMETNKQTASMKKVNRPSDDPAGTVRLMNYRASLATNEQHQTNSSEAQSWLASTDSALQAAQVQLTLIMEKASQAANGALTDENRKQISFELRQAFEQLINIANTEVSGGNHLFSGHKTGESAYGKVLGVNTNSPEMEGVNFDVDGSADYTVMVRFPEDGTLDGVDPVDFEYSDDGGKTWETGTTEPPSNTINAGGVIINIPDDAPNVKAFNPDEDHNKDGNGTLLYVRPSAVYKGDDNDKPPEIDIFGNNNDDITATTGGTFDTDVRIRFDSNATVNTDGTVNYSYSSDNGQTWEHATATTSATSDSLRLVVPGGYVDVEVGGAGEIEAGQQMVVRPSRASDIGFEISPDQFVTVTNAGKDIFGGVYQGKGEDFPSVVEGPNIFETVSDLIAALETDDIDACGQAVKDLKTVSEHLLTNLAEVGGKHNRVDLNTSILESNSDGQKTRMSNIEDANLTELFTEITKQQMAYQSVLQSSSMIMNLSLMNYM